MREIKTGMDIKEFAEIMIHVGNVYGSKFVVNSRNTAEQNDSIIRAWYRYIGKYDADVFRSATDSWIIKNQNAPTISDLKSDLNHGMAEKYRKLEIEDGAKIGSYFNADEWRGK